MKKAVFKSFLALFLVLNGITAYGNTDSGRYNPDSLWRVKESREVRIDGKVSIADVKTPADEVEKLIYIPAVHPAAKDSIPSTLYDEVGKRNRVLAKDSLTSAELFWVLRPYLAWLRHLDPHLRAEPQPAFPDRSRKTMKQAQNLPVPGFLLLNVNDTLIVSRSVDPLFESGDRILTINDTPASDYLRYCYDDRYIYPFTLFANHHYELVTASDFKVRLVRNGLPQEVTVPGIPWADVYLGLIRQQEFQTRIFPEAKTGYFSITEFYPENSLLINKLRKAIIQAKKQGCNSFILDLRGNPGGSGSAFDKLLSVFIDKPVIPYMKSQKLRVSEQTRNEYEFLADSMLGQLVEVPDKDIIKEVSLHQKMYIPGMTYYVLMNKDTGSVAASFCNIMQYNDAARLVGEPLLHNALKYGEVTDAWYSLTFLLWSSLSTVEFDECTRAVDGVLMPDIAIPYVAADYLSGNDAMLDKLLTMIKSNDVN